MNYRSLKKEREKPICGREIFLGIRFFIYFTNAMERFESSNMRHLLLLSVGMGIFVAKDLIFHNAVVGRMDLP